MRTNIITACTDDAIVDFLDIPDFEGRGFEMWEFTKAKYSPNMKEDTFVNFLSLLDLHQKTTKVVANFSLCIRQLVIRITMGGIDLPQNPVTMLVMRGMDSKY